MVYWDEPVCHKLEEEAVSLMITMATGQGDEFNNSACAIMTIPSKDSGEWTRAGIFWLPFGNDGFAECEEFMGSLELKTVTIV